MKHPTEFKSSKVETEYQQIIFTGQRRIIPSQIMKMEHLSETSLFDRNLMDLIA